MAVKRSLAKKKAPIKRAIKRAPAASTEQDLEEMELPESNEVIEEADLPAALDESFKEAPLTPEQQAEKDALDGANAGAKAANESLPERQAVERTAKKFKDTVHYQEFMALPLAERRRLIDEEQDEIKQKRKISITKK